MIFNYIFHKEMHKHLYILIRIQIFYTKINTNYTNIIALSFNHSIILYLIIFIAKYSKI